VDRHLYWFHILAIMNSAIMNMYRYLNCMCRHFPLDICQGCLAESYSSSIFSCFFMLFYFMLLWKWSLNWVLHVCKTDYLVLEPYLQSILLWLFWTWRSLGYFSGVAVNRDPSDLILSSSLSYRCEPLTPSCCLFSVFFSPHWVSFSYLFSWW
jgi:hypothetical protein